MILRNLLIVAVALLILTRANVFILDEKEQVRRFTRWSEFDYVTWMLDAALLKGAQAALDFNAYLPENVRSEMVEQYLRDVYTVRGLEGQVSLIYADPNVESPKKMAALLELELAEARERRDRMAPLVESAVQMQISDTLAGMGLTFAGQPIPPVAYHVTDLPYALITSPRDRIEAKDDISLEADISLDQITLLENQVEKNVDLSALVVPVGGVGVYPTMVINTSDMPFLMEVVAHEWVHNYLTLRPLGIRYFDTPEMRNINETTASIAGLEISRALLARYYPQYLPPEQPPAPVNAPPASPEEPLELVFNPRAELHETRVTVDAMLAEGKIEEAEEYMEMRRMYLWDNGYRLRRINQAYFAFYGAYAETPGGAAGEDPVGPAVRAFREQSPSLKDFLEDISQITSFEELQELVSTP